MSLTTAGLTNLGSGQGVTAHYAFSYDTSLLPSGATIVNNFMLAAEQDFSLMQSWFDGIDIPFDYPLGVQVDQASSQFGGASWPTPAPAAVTFGSGSFVQIDPGTNPNAGKPLSKAAFLRYLLVAEVTEMFMMQQSIGWYVEKGLFSGGNEGSIGEGLSRFLSAQLLVYNGLGNPPPAFQVASLWLNNSGGRQDYVDGSPDDNQPDPVTGCTTVYLVPPQPTWFQRKRDRRRTPFHRRS